jgi:RHS repeat-associated protein
MASHRTLDSEWAGCTNPGSDCLSVSPGGTQSSNFDPFGRAQATTRADGSTITVDYPDGSILFSDTKKAVTVNNINGACSGTCSGGTSGVVTTYVYDSYGRLTSVTEPPSGDLTTYAYDANGKFTTVTQGGQGRTFTYDHFGFLRSESTPEKGTVTSNTIGSLGNVAQKTENDGTVISTIYDAAGRGSCTGQGVIVMTSGTCANNWSVPTVYVQNSYDGNGFAGGNNPLGKLTHRVGSNPLTSPSPTVTDDFSYSGLAGRLSKLSTTVSGSIGQVDQSWAYNNLGLVAQHNHARVFGVSAAPLSESTTYTAGLPAALYANGLPVVKGVDYAPSGALNHYMTGLFSGKTVTTTIAPDTTLLPRPTRVSTVGASINFDTGAYTYDGAGNITCLSQSPNCVSPIDTFSYDNRSRLISASLSGAGSQSYVYDRYGNRSSPLPSGCTVSPTNNRVTNIVGQTCIESYDGRGNMTHSPLAEDYTYDALDRTKTITASSLTSKYIFDGSSERVVKIDSNNNWTYTFRDEAARVSTEFAGSSQSRDNMFLGRQIVGSYANGSVGSNGPVWSFYSSDHLGTPRLVTDVSATQIEARRYWPFGEQVVAAQPFEHIRFAAMEQDTEAGPGNDRYNDHARHHAAGLGRFLTADVLGGTADDPQGWNRYAYGRNNPLKYVDPNGQSTLTFVVGALAEFGSNLTLGAVHVESEDPDFQKGQNAADQATVAAASLEFEIGKDAIAGGLVAAPASGGSSLSISGAGVLAVIHAPAMALVATTHLFSRQGGQPGQGTEEPRGGHDKGARKSTEDKHEKGVERRKRDQGGERADDARRPYRRTDKKKASLPPLPIPVDHCNGDPKCGQALPR